MLRRLPASMPSRSVLASAGFAWWYLDVVDPDGSGLVLIWSFGLPFLPGVTTRAEERPSLNLAVYERGRPVFYCLQELDGAWLGDGFRFGDSTLRTSFAGDRWTLEAHLDGELPAGRFAGSITAEGRTVRAPPGGGGEHEWAPLATGTAEAELSAHGERYRVRGRAYHDRNSSPLPLGELGLREWWWGRIALPDGDLVFYRLVAPDGRTEDHVLHLGDEVRLGASIVPEGRRASLYGPTWPTRVVVDGVPVVLGHTLDEGPFYVRLQARVGSATGYAEIVRADRVGQALPLVRMAVQRQGPDGLRAANSMWLPLFAGASRGRIGRLARWWLG